MRHVLRYTIDRSDSDGIFIKLVKVPRMIFPAKVAGISIGVSWLASNLAMRAKIWLSGADAIWD